MIAAPPVWQRIESAPADIDNCAIAATLLCECGKGAKVVVTGSRLHGQWVVDTQHALDLTHFMVLPRHPELTVQ